MECHLRSEGKQAGTHCSPIHCVLRIADTGPSRYLNRRGAPSWRQTQWHSRMGTVWLTVRAVQTTCCLRHQLRSLCMATAVCISVICLPYRGGHGGGQPGPGFQERGHRLQKYFQAQASEQSEDPVKKKKKKIPGGDFLVDPLLLPPSKDFRLAGIFPHPFNLPSTHPRTCLCPSKVQIRSFISPAALDAEPTRATHPCVSFDVSLTFSSGAFGCPPPLRRIPSSSNHPHPPTYTYPPTHRLFTFPARRVIV